MQRLAIQLSMNTTKMASGTIRGVRAYRAIFAVCTDEGWHLSGLIRSTGGTAQSTIWRD